MNQRMRGYCAYCGGLWAHYLGCRATVTGSAYQADKA